MPLRIIKTEGYALLAEVEVDGHRLFVMDDFSMLPDDLCRRHGIFPGGTITGAEPEFAHLESDEPWSWDDMFSGNPNHEKKLVSTGDWSYDAYGQIVSINPVICDFGVLQLDIGDFTNDPRCVGEWIHTSIARLDLTFRC